MKKIKEVGLWIIGIFFIITFLVYVKQIIVPSILILITGLILLPPINEKIKSKLNDEEKVNKYKIIRCIMTIVFIFVFGLNVPTQNEIEKQSYNQNISYDTNNISDAINQTEVDKSIELTITETNGKYTGEKVDGKKEGIGKYEWTDSSVYEGEFSNDQINGQGKLTIPQKGTYEGKFVNGKKNGQGIYTFANGDTYKGNWENDKMSGQGTYTFANGDKYEGEFLNNKFNGQGTYTKGSNKYKGTWSDNEYKK